MSGILGTPGRRHERQPMWTTTDDDDDDDDDDDNAVDSVDSVDSVHNFSFVPFVMGPWAHGPSPEGCPEKLLYMYR